MLTLTKKLTNKIRTNKAMASFITNLMSIGKSHDNLNYNCVTVEYMDNYNALKSYIAFLETMAGRLLPIQRHSTILIHTIKYQNFVNEMHTLLLGRNFLKWFLLWMKTSNMEKMGSY